MAFSIQLKMALFARLIIGPFHPTLTLIAFAGSEMALRLFGKEGADGMLAHAKERKASGEKFCDCAACAAVEAILSKKDEMI